MNDQELNEYIGDYLINDKTKRAILLTGGWGTGKSYYINKADGLIKYIESLNNGKIVDKSYRCCVISLYGISELSEISKKIYWDLHFGKKLPQALL